MVRLPAASLEPFEAFTCFNSPYAAHDDASAIDLYPSSQPAPAPVGGEVTAIHRVRAPRQPYGREFDYVIAIDTTDAATTLSFESGAAAVVRVLHVEPTVSVGDTVSIGSPLGRTLRAGFFAPWVANHLHVDVRPSTVSTRRAGGTTPLSLSTAVEAYHWDGTGTVRSRGRTFVELEVPSPTPRADTPWVGLATDEGHVLDGGLPHYAGGGLVDRLVDGRVASREATPVSLLGTRVGTARGPIVDWAPLTVTANDTPVTGLSLACVRPEAIGVKLVCPDHDFAIGEAVTVALGRPSRTGNRDGRRA